MTARLLGSSAGLGPLLATDPWLLHGASLLRDVAARVAALDLTQLGSLVAIAGVVPTAWRCVRALWHEVRGWVRQGLLTSVVIPGGDPLNTSVVRWLAEQRPPVSPFRFFTGRTGMRSAGAAADPAAALKKTRHAVQFLPHWTTRCVRHEGHVIFIERHVTSPESPLAVDAASPDGLGGETLTVSCLGWSAAAVQRFVLACRVHADLQAQFYVVVYARDRFGMRWTPKARTPLRQLDTVHVDGAAKVELVADVRRYLDARTQRRYQARSMPYRRGYLFYGPPGTGKTSLSVALAGEFGLDLYEVKMPGVGSDDELEQMFLDLPPRCVVLLEDIDAVWMGASRTADSAYGSQNGSQNSPQNSDSDGARCTLSGLLNVLDGVGSSEGRLVIMTTNHADRLDSALVRPGRIDYRLFLGPISRACATQMFTRMFAPDLADDSCLGVDEVRALAADFARHIPERAVTPSQLQGYFQRHLDSPQGAVTGIRAWIEQLQADQLCM